MLTRLVLICTLLVSLSALANSEAKPRRHQCGPISFGPCSTGVPLNCIEGWVDSCTRPTSLLRRCVVANTGLSCDVPANLTCPVNFVDGCLTGETLTHTCMPQEKQVCDVPVNLVCPENFMDECLEVRGEDDGDDDGDVDNDKK